MSRESERQNELPNGAGADPKFSVICACERPVTGLVGIQKETIDEYQMRLIINLQLEMF